MEETIPNKKLGIMNASENLFKLKELYYGVFPVGYFDLLFI